MDRRAARPVACSGVETVREFQVLINNYSAEYGRSSGGIVTAVTRSGTNSFRGAAFGFFRDDALDSQNYFDDPDSDKPPLERHQAGGYLGGPMSARRRSSSVATKVFGRTGA